MSESSIHFQMSSQDFNSEIIEMKVKDELSQRNEEWGGQFIQDTLQTDMTSIVDDMKVEHEEVIDFHISSNTSTSEAEEDSELKTVFNIPHIECGSVNAQEKDLNNFYLDLLQCEQDCETCLKYMRKLSDHVRATHGRTQQIRDPLLIDPLHVDPDPLQAEQSSSVQVTCEVVEDIVKMECAEEKSRSNSEFAPDFEIENGNGNDLEYRPFPRLSKKVLHKNVVQSNTWERRYKCEVCNKSFYRQRSLTAHGGIHTRGKPKKCGKRFTRNENLNLHMRKIHSGNYDLDLAMTTTTDSDSLSLENFEATNRKRKIPEGQVQGQSSSILKQKLQDPGLGHLNFLCASASAPLKFTCGQCHGQAEFFDEFGLNEHLSTHPETGNFEGQGQGQSSATQKLNLQDYDQLNFLGASPSAPLKFTCGQCHCQAEFFDESGLIGHLSTHTQPETESEKIRPRQQSIPGKKLFLGHAESKSILKPTNMEKHEENSTQKLGTHSNTDPDASSESTHLLIHTGEISLTCEHCKMTFVGVKELNEHLLNHTRQKFPTCQLCKKQFVRMEDLTDHLSTHTHTAKLFGCQHCKQIFTNQTGLIQHLGRTINPVSQPSQCLKCFKVFEFKCALALHLINHALP